MLAAQGGWGDSIEVRSERLYCDGIRRIREYVTQPMGSLQMQVELGNSEAIASLSENPDLDQQGLTLGAEAEDLGAFAGQLVGGSDSPGGGGSGGGWGGGGEPGFGELRVWLDREYVWGRGDRGVDELLVQYGSAEGQSDGGSAGAGSRPWYMITDQGGDVVGVCDLEFVPGPPSGLRARTRLEIVYDAYGSVLEAVESNPAGGHALPVQKVGHKGLFFDSLVGVVDALTGAELPRLASPGSLPNGGMGPGAGPPWTGATQPGDVWAMGAGGAVSNSGGHVPILGHARNRTLHTALQRWNQRDPNATGQGVLDRVSAYHGLPAGVDLLGLDLEFFLGDGVSAHGYVRSNPFSRGDPLGLYSWEEFGEDAMGASFGIPGPSDWITGALTSLVQEYAANLDWDVEWAMEWEYDDDWSTREDSSWVILALGQGIYESFEVGFGDHKANPLDLFASASGTSADVSGFDPANTPGSQNVIKKGNQTHHIATNTGKHGSDMEEIFQRAGLHIEGDYNKISVQHGGRHPKGYHLFVKRCLNDAISGLKPPAAGIALKAELKSLGDFIKKNPHFMYDSAGGKKTGWKGMRDMHGPKSSRGSGRRRR